MLSSASSPAAVVAQAQRGRGQVGEDRPLAGQQLGRSALAQQRGQAKLSLRGTLAITR
ncbi:MAG: hypothetical protein IPO88_33615 [Nannocystis sp.]|uniref:hypothetical protein n=1 Tax=Nannocystis sp. TaxID=1962667 RepID=UPI002425DB87|nr:hypothetical protein [Nannocystis sp.]MBK9758371.1 hypothetical protein [Nannocystis sp.]